MRPRRLSAALALLGALSAPKQRGFMEGLEGLALFDSHCHLQLPRLIAQAPAAVARAQAAGVVGAAVCGCEAADWAEVEALAEAFPDFVSPQFGVHPWWVPAHAESDDWVDELRARLLARAGAGVGECGLDGARKKDIPMEVQLKVLRAQLGLAKELQRPVSLHCVAAHGAMLETLQSSLGPHAPGIVLHSYCGSPEMVAAFSKLNCFFSFSASILHIGKHAAALRVVPEDRLLLETDSPDQLPKRLRGLEHPDKAYVQADADGELLNEPAWLPLILRGAAEIREVEPADLATLTAANARRVFGGPSR